MFRVEFLHDHRRSALADGQGDRSLRLIDTGLDSSRAPGALCATRCPSDASLPPALARATAMRQCLLQRPPPLRLVR